jgi:hypothetical protein
MKLKRQIVRSAYAVATVAMVVAGSGAGYKWW